MSARIYPASKLKGTVLLPSSKSYSIRAFITASCGGSSLIKNASVCDDAVVARRVTTALGCRVKRVGTRDWRISSQKRRILPKEINVNESGTVLRLLLPLLILRAQPVKVVGKKTLVGRPNAFLTKTLRQMGGDLKGSGPKESVPILIRPGCVRGGDVHINGSLSSQFISALLMACPQLGKPTRLTLTGRKIVSEDYVDMTINVLKEAGVRVQKKNKRQFLIPAPQAFKGLKSFIIPSDYGLAAFLLAAGALVKSDITLKGPLRDKYIQADGQILSVLRAFGVRFTKTSSTLKLCGPFSLKGNTFSLKDAPDLVPITAVLALFAKGVTRITNIQHARAKESDRISDLRKELLKIGAQVTETKNTLVIKPSKRYKTNVLLNPHHDHRLAMAFAVLGLKIGTTVKNRHCVRKSYPDFWRDLSSLGAKVSFF